METRPAIKQKSVSCPISTSLYKPPTPSLKMQFLNFSISVDHIEEDLKFDGIFDRFSFLIFFSFNTC
ncbi:hypothetical protein L1987_82583 [Smallanthus sonchifolius]|uniref:Uncharacterized protein n=1 Tax=Smallanthus sonchifolius TaxID=185202 RepID=A0ACB8YBW7_9ASTR|nr:hypothetical protein L1987_82583 [Smallanthus sonchifolius]